MNNFLNIRKQDPLKQGLKLFLSGDPIKAKGLIRKQDPLKQGLKLLGSNRQEPEYYYS